MNPEPPSAPCLIVLDVDGVIFRSHFLLEMSRRVGLWAYLRAWVLCAFFNLGILPFSRLLELVYARFVGQTEDHAREEYEHMRLIPNARESIASLQQAGHKVAAVSSGVPDAFLADLCQRLRLDAYAGIQCGIVETEGGRRLDGTISGDLTQPGGKIAAVERMHQTFGADWEHTIVAMDDRNNLELVDRAAVSIGVRPNWPVRRAATYIADAGDMEEVRQLIEMHLSGSEPTYPSPEAFRKVVHVLGSLVPFAARVSMALTSAGLGAVIALYLWSEAWRLNGLSLPGFTWITRHSARQEELRRPSIGPVYLAVACLLCLWLFPWPIAASAIFLASLGDAAAAVVGRRFGRHPLPYNRQKTLEGTAAFFFTGLAATLWLLPMPACLIACAVGALVESLPLRDADNIVPPLAAAAAALWAQSL